ncbi:MAG: transcription elongation factor GreA [Dehalococcoidia bacterium]
MTETLLQDTSLHEAEKRYLASLKPSDRTTQASVVHRFVLWFGPERRMRELRGVDIERYTLENATATDAEQRLGVVRSFLAYAKKAGITAENLGVHVRLRRTNSSSGQAELMLEERIEVTPEGLANLRRELEDLRAERPKIAESLRAAMADKDFRENAPLDAAREHQAHVEARIRELDSMLKRAVLVEAAGGVTARLGSRVRVRDLQNDRELSYTLVGPGEVNAAEGRISIASPVGRALVDRIAGEEVDVVAPARTFRYRIEAVES